MRREKVVSGPRRWTPSTFSPIHRAIGFLRPMLASGASGTPKRAMRSVSLMIRLRRLDPRSLDDRGARPVVRLGDEHAGRAGPRADPAAGAEVDGVIRGVAADPGTAEALGLRTDVLRAGEVIGHARDRADGGAHVALDAGVGAERWELARGGVVEGHAATARFRASEAAARCALASATPSPHRSSR